MLLTGAVEAKDLAQGATRPGPVLGIAGPNYKTDCGAHSTHK